MGRCYKRSVLLLFLFLIAASYSVIATHNPWNGGIGLYQPCNPNVQAGNDDNIKCIDTVITRATTSARGQITFCGLVPAGTVFQMLQPQTYTYTLPGQVARSLTYFVVQNQRIEQPGNYCLPKLSVSQFYPTNNYPFYGYQFIRNDITLTGSCVIDEQCAGINQETGLPDYAQGGVCREPEGRPGVKYCFKNNIGSTEQCSFKEQCQNGLCINNYCQQTNLGTDSACALDVQCQSSHCDNGVCQAREVSPFLIPAAQIQAKTGFHGLSTVTWSSSKAGYCAYSGGAQRDVPIGGSRDSWQSVQGTFGKFHTKVSSPTTFDLLCTSPTGQTHSASAIVNPQQRELFDAFFRYNFDSVVSGSVPDVSGHNLAADLRGNPPVVGSNLDGSALRMEGTDDSVVRLSYETSSGPGDTSNTFLERFPDGFTVSFWVKPQNNLAEEGLFQWAQPGQPLAIDDNGPCLDSDSRCNEDPFLAVGKTNTGILSVYADGNRFNLDSTSKEFSSNARDTYYAANTAAPAQYGASWNQFDPGWNQVIITRDIFHKYHFYLNGRFLGTLHDDDNLRHVVNAQTFYFGSAYPRYFNGELDEVVVLKRAMSREEISNWYNDYIARSAPLIGVVLTRCTQTTVSENICNGIDDDCDNSVD